MRITADALIKMGFADDTAWRCKDGGHPRPDSHANDLVPTLIRKAERVWVVCWADLSQWWIVAEGDGSGAWIEFFIPNPVTVKDVADLCRLLGVPIEGGPYLV